MRPAGLDTLVSGHVGSPQLLADSGPLACSSTRAVRFRFDDPFGFQVSAKRSPDLLTFVDPVSVFNHFQTFGEILVNIEAEKPSACHRGRMLVYIRITTLSTSDLPRPRLAFVAVRQATSCFSVNTADADAALSEVEVPRRSHLRPTVVSSMNVDLMYQKWYY
jgi:hypothetical protein